jgi:hypothetical protein
MTFAISTGKGYASLAIMWFLLGIVLLTSVFKAFFTFGQYETFGLMAIIATEVATYFAVCVALFKPNMLSSIGAFIASVVWFVNQLACWESYTGVVFNTFGDMFFVTTAVFNTILLTFALYGNFKAPLELGRAKTVLMGSVAFVFLYAFLKMLIDFVYYINDWYDAGISGGLWSLGIVIISLGTLVGLVTSAKSRKTILIFMLIGLAISTFAGLYYGLALTVSLR